MFYQEQHILRNLAADPSPRDLPLHLQYLGVRSYAEVYNPELACHDVAIRQQQLGMPTR
jgi:hypothetical protein